MVKDEPEVCPHCGASFLGDRIPEEYREHYGPDVTHFLSGVVGIYSRALDRTVAWKCLSCNVEWPRE